MNAATKPLLKPAAAPPKGIVRMVMALRNFLFKLTDNMVPPQVALIERLGSYYLLHAIKAAAQLGLADRLEDGPKTAAELAKAAGAVEEPLERLLRALSSYGIFSYRNGRYAQNRLSAALREDSQGSLRELTLFVSAPYHLRVWDHLTDTLRTGKKPFQATHGKPLFDYLQGFPEDAAHFAGAMVSLTEMDAPTLAASYDFGALGEGAKVCDVAGGRGTLIAAIVARHKKLKGVLFDEAEVLSGAGAFLASYGVESRVELVPGNFFKSVPSGCAAYILKDILHDWNDENALSILKTVRAAMPPGGLLLIAEMVVDKPEERFFGTLLDLEMLTVMDGGRQRSRAQFEALFKQAGFRFSKIISAAGPTSLVEAVAV